MYEIIKNVIDSGRYELSDMLTKIDIIWLQGNITDNQKSELAELARKNAIPENSYSIQKQLDSIFVNLAELAATAKANMDAITVLQGGTVEEAIQEEWPEYIQPTGAHDAFNTGDRITFNGKHYICRMDGCVWDPVTYPAGWAEEE